MTLAAGAILVAVAAIQAQSTFTKIVGRDPVIDAARCRGAAWVDFDNDGDLDLYVSNVGGTNLLYRNEGQGVFTRITDGPIVNAGAGSFGASWADLDNNGRIDLFVSRQDGGRGLLFLQGMDGTFTKTAMPAGGNSFGSAWADYDNDGFVDLLVGDTTRSILWHNDGEGNLVAVTNTSIQTAGTGGLISWVDYDNDGEPDVFVTTSTGAGPAHLYRNDGNGVFTPIPGQLNERSTRSTGVAWGDYDNDGFLDVFVCRLDINFQQKLPSFLFHNNGDGTFTQLVQSPFTTDTGFALGCSWADYDNDGWLDLFVTENEGNSNRLYRNNGDGSFSRVHSGPIATDRGDSAGSSWGDYDRDGFLDLFVATSSGGNGSQPNDYLYHNDGNGNGWLTIKCVGTRSNRSAIGTKIRVKATINGLTFWQMREINTGDGLSQNAMEAHFGLGGATKVEMVRIEWPSGTVQEFKNIDAKQYLTVIEPARLVPIVRNAAPQFILHGGRNRTYDIQFSTDPSSWSLLQSVTIDSLNGTALFDDPGATNVGNRFYRAELR